MANALGYILMLFSASFALPLICAIIYIRRDTEGWETILAFVIPALLSLLTGLFFTQIIGKNETLGLRDREAFAVVGIGWLAIAAFGAMPYLISGTFDFGIEGFVNSYFESMSGFTTTGSTVLEPSPGNDYLDDYAHSVLLWRSQTQWMGGMGIIVLSVVVFSRLFGGGMGLMRAEVPGTSVARLRPKMQHTAMALWLIYALFTLMEAVLLRLAGMSTYDAINHSFTTLATGGFSTHFASIAYYSNTMDPIGFGGSYALIEVILILFMAIAGTNFVLHYTIIMKGDRIRALFKDPEFRFYILLLLFATLVMTAVLTWRTYPAYTASRYAVFQAVSIMTTTGYANADFETWPVSARMLLIILMFVGGCAGSTGGAIKVIRVLVILKMARREIRKVVHPKAVVPINIGGTAIPEETCMSIAAFFILYLAIFIVATFLIALIGAQSGGAYDFPSALSAVAATLGNVGPGLGAFGPTVTYLHLHWIGKIILTLCMWTGRLELYAGVFLFFPGSWRK